MLQGVQSGRHRLAACVCATAAALCLLVALGPTPVPHAQAAASGTVTMSPPTSSIRAGETVAITIDLNNAVNVHEVDVSVTYDPAVLSVVDADPVTDGTQVLPGPFFNGAGPGTMTQNNASGGALRYGYRLYDTREASGSGTLATVEFQGIGAGDAKLGFGTVMLKDANFAPSSPDTSGGAINVGGSDSAAAATDTPTDTATAITTTTATATPTDDPPTGTPTPSATAKATGTASPTRTATGTPSITVTPRPSSTPRITVVLNSNDPTETINQKLGVDGVAAKQQQGLPDAGNAGPGTQWWRWTFFGAALMLGVAGWFFTFALHQSDRDVVLFDRHDRRRRRHW